MLVDAWSRAAPPGSAVLALAGIPPGGALPGVAGVHPLGQLDPHQLRNFHAAADVLIVPSIPTRSFREPWGLVVNEAMHQGTPVIATDAVGAAAGRLVRDGETGVIVPARNPAALSSAILRLRDDPSLRSRLGEAGRAAAAQQTFAAWAQGFSDALGTISSKGPSC